jgi:hypothetical protein
MQLMQNLNAARHYYLPMLAVLLYAVSDSTSCIPCAAALQQIET